MPAAGIVAPDVSVLASSYILLGGVRLRNSVIALFSRHANLPGTFGKVVKPLQSLVPPAPAWSLANGS